MLLCSSKRAAPQAVILSMRLFRHQQIGRYLSLTPVIDPPIDKPERPCTLVLAEDSYLNGNRSWSESFSTLPADFGVPFTQQTTSGDTLDGVLLEMKQDLETIAQPILVTRGPWTSWMAQFYLEGMPLAGLIMVDPLMLDQQHSCEQYETLVVEKSVQESKLFQEFCAHWDHWALQLEPGAVPMQVVSTAPTWSWQFEQATETALRHGNGEFGKVPVVEAADLGVEDCKAEIVGFIEERVL